MKVSEIIKDQDKFLIYLKKVFSKGIKTRKAEVLIEHEELDKRGLVGLLKDSLHSISLEDINSVSIVEQEDGSLITLVA